MCIDIINTVFAYHNGSVSLKIICKFLIFHVKLNHKTAIPKEQKLSLSLLVGYLYFYKKLQASNIKLFQFLCS